ncbi:MAG: SH3 domain-containing protein, partial [Ancalomicrobiaceae bacterium]|nr:SH3 domain-containing protein [Ancalomicrobiaceae bacterium]
MIFRTTLSALPLLLASFAGPTPAAAVEGWARLSGTLRAGPESDYPAITRVARGDALDVFGCLSGYDWCDVAVGGERGWFPGSRIELASDGRRVRMSRSVAGGIGLSILSFGMTDYWASHYEGRSFYRDDRYWRRHGMHPPQPGQARPDRPRSEPN